MPKIDFKKQNIPFTQVANGVLNDPELSLEAKGLYAYLYSKPEGWQFSSLRMHKESKNGRDSIRKTLNELIEKGYLLRCKLADGRMVYKVIFPPLDPKPENPSLATDPKPEKATDWKPHRLETSPISNKDVLVINNTSNKDSKAPALQGKQWNELIDCFEEVNPLFEEFYKNTTERKALEYLVSKLGFDKVRSIISHLPAITSQPYAPKVTKPSELRRDLGKLVTFYKQNQNKITKYGGAKIY